MALETQHFFDPRTSTLTYVVFDRQARTGVVVDPVLDFDPKSGRTSEATVEPVFRFIEEHELAIPFALDTHAHADHMTALPCFKARYRSRTVIGREIVKVQQLFGELYNLGAGFATDGSQFDVLLGDDEAIDVGPFGVKAHHSPGHTPACSVWHIGQMVFVGDVLFMPDFGTARCDFPGGSAEQLYDSVRRLYQLPGETEVYTCHDYQPGGRELRFRSTIEEQRTKNVQLTQETPREQFVKFREERDAKLELPALMLAVLQVNIRAGELPPAESNGKSYLKIPINAF
jgi:glyoxylase-like metal-dependent hydrolase (beta-lactamase superfamily II)